MFEITRYSGITDSQKSDVQTFHGALCKEVLADGEMKLTPTTIVADLPVGIMFKADQNGRALPTFAISDQVIEIDEMVALQRGGFEFITDKVTGVVAVGDEVEPDTATPGNLKEWTAGTAFGIVRDVHVHGGAVVWARIYFYGDIASKR